VIEPTPRAAQVVAQSEAAARRFNPDARIRLRRDGAGVRFELTDAPAAGDERVFCAGVELLVEPGLDGILDTGEHNLPTLSARE
jgi:hypothetical protein